MRLGRKIKIKKALERTNRFFSPIFVILEAFLLSNAIELSPSNFIHYFIAFNQKIFWIIVLVYSSTFLYNLVKIRKKKFILIYRRDIF
ncbi:MAG: hypothetical protein DRJ37_05985 [Thermoprotei archaeon]|nr:MAG: hypothetical protein DRJ37_05985 [Thermoprotei archaeon]